MDRNSTIKHIIIFIPCCCEDEIRKFLWIANFLKEFTVTKCKVEFFFTADKFIQPRLELRDAFAALAPTKSYQCKAEIPWRPRRGADTFWEVIEYINSYYEKDKGFILWFEPDMIPVKPDWPDRLMEE